MNDNPYTPPKAVVADQEPRVSLERPPIVVLAVRLMWTGFAIALVGSVPGFFRQPENVPNSVAIASFGMANAAAISYGVFSGVWRGRNWARWLD